MPEKPPMNVTAILASPRPNGNSRLLLDRALETLRSIGLQGLTIQEFVVYDLDIAPCLACDDCFQEGRCSQRDDMDRVQAALEQADLILVASPLYFSGPPGPLKLLIDRCQNIWAARTLLGRRHENRAGRRALVILAAARKDPKAFAAIEDILKVWLRSLDVPRHQVVTCPGVDGPGEAATRTGRLEAVDRALLELLQDMGRT